MIQICDKHFSLRIFVVFVEKKEKTFLVIENVAHGQDQLCHRGLRVHSVERICSNIDCQLDDESCDTSITTKETLFLCGRTSG